MGDPFSVASGSVFLRRRDLQVSQTAGDLHFFRSFTSTADTWNQPVGQKFYPLLRGIPKPFGAAPELSTSVHWWHSLFSFIADGPNDQFQGQTAFFRDLNGHLSSFSECSTAACWLSPTSRSQSQRDLVQLGTPDGGVGYTVTTEDGRRLEYGANWVDVTPGRFSFLTRVANANNETIARVSYATPLTPDGGTCPTCCTSCDAGSGSAPNCQSGAPYVSAVTMANGTVLTFSYVTLVGNNGVECVLDRISDGTSVVAKYNYAQSGLLSSVVVDPGLDGGVAETYSYYDAGFSVTGPRGTVTYQFDPNNQGKVISEVSPNDNLAVSWGTTRSIANSAVTDQYLEGARR